MKDHNPYYDERQEIEALKAEINALLRNTVVLGIPAVIVMLIAVYKYLNGDETALFPRNISEADCYILFIFFAVFSAYFRFMHILKTIELRKIDEE